MTVIESAGGKPFSLDYFDTEVPIPLFDAQHSTATTFSEININLTSIPTTITPGAFWGCHVIPLELDVSDDAILTDINGFLVRMGRVYFASDTQTVTAETKVGGSVSMGITTEDFNSLTVTFADAIDWNTNVLKDYTEFFNFELLYDKTISTISFGPMRNNQRGVSDSDGNTTMYQGYTTVDPSASNGGKITEEATALVVYYKYDDDCFADMDIASGAVGSGVGNLNTHRYYQEV